MSTRLRLDRQREHLACPNLDHVTRLNRARGLMDTDEGLRTLLALAPEWSFVLDGGPWAEVDRLVPELVAGGLRAGGLTTTCEVLSELRLLWLATDRRAPRAMRQKARSFLRRVMALNLALLFPAGTEEERTDPTLQLAQRLFRLLAKELGLQGLCRVALDELDQILAQRPLQQDGVQDLLEQLARATRGPWPRPRRLRRYLHQTRCHARRPYTVWGRALRARRFGTELLRTGLAGAAQARWVRTAVGDPGLLSDLLGLSPAGRALLAEDRDAIGEVIECGVRESTAPFLYGLGRAIERGAFGNGRVVGGFQRLAHARLQPELSQTLQARYGDPHAALIAGAAGLLGQPLGVGQGANPTCQSARALSLWASHDPGHLISALVAAARDGDLHMSFEGASLESARLPAGVAKSIDPRLDPVSLALVPHLDRLYDEMMRRASGRGVDPHAWVNRAFYGRFIPRGFAAALTAHPPYRLTDLDGFVRTFYASHHPKFGCGHPLMAPNPVGLCVTDSQGRLLGPHAVSLLRVAHDPNTAQLRAYFFNPNNEGRQDWGFGVKPTVAGHGERHGESSLPFSGFASRLYAFHFDPRELGDPLRVPADEVAAVCDAARLSWALAF